MLPMISIGLWYLIAAKSVLAKLSVWLPHEVIVSLFAEVAVLSKPVSTGVEMSAFCMVVGIINIEGQGQRIWLAQLIASRTEMPSRLS